MTPERFVEQLQVALADKLKSVVLYGSAATGDFMEGVSGYNVLVVAEPKPIAAGVLLVTVGPVTGFVLLDAPE